MRVKVTRTHIYYAYRPENNMCAGSDLTGLKARLVKRGRKFEKLCNGPPEGSFRQYAGPMMNHGVLDMLVDPYDEVST